jgi:AcrR family transcriptional regulator
MRLRREDWLHAARIQLGNEGPSGIKIEALARTLGVSKGSFYWHFADRQELLWSLLELWEQSTDLLIAQASEESTPQAAFRRLFQEIHALGVTGELGIFAWAKQDLEVKSRVQQVEQKRILFLQTLFQQVGYDEKQALHRAELSYLSFLGFLYRGEEGILQSFLTLGENIIHFLMDK